MLFSIFYLLKFEIKTSKKATKHNYGQIYFILKNKAMTCTNLHQNTLHSSVLC